MLHGYDQWKATNPAEDLSEDDTCSMCAGCPCDECPDCNYRAEQEAKNREIREWARLRALYCPELPPDMDCLPF